MMPVDEDENNNLPPTADGKTYHFGDQIFSEVEVDETPPDDDESTVWTDNGDNVEEISDDEDIAMNVTDISHCSFNGHNDSVYCVAVHPTTPGVVVTGKTLLCC